MYYFNDMSKNDLMKHIGHISQIAGAKHYTFSEGKAKGVSAIDVKTGTGLSFTVVSDRGMDIAQAEYKGIPLSFISKTGIVSPSYYEEPGSGFLRNFYGGLLTTCGLTYMGAPCEDEGIKLGMHGRISNTPAYNVSIYEEWEDDDYVIKIRGKVNESSLFGENITLTREIITHLGSNKIILKDQVENEGYNAQPLMLLYHCNFGFPLLSSTSTLFTSNGTVRGRDDIAKNGLEHYSTFEDPTHDYKEQVFYHDLSPDDNNHVFAGIYNNSLNETGLGVKMTFNKEQLPHLIQWKQMGEGDYVLGIEPGTWYPEGRAKAKKLGQLQMIEPGEIKYFYIEFEIIDTLPKI